MGKQETPKEIEDILNLKIKYSPEPILEEEEKQLDDLEEKHNEEKQTEAKKERKRLEDKRA